MKKNTHKPSVHSTNKNRPPLESFYIYILLGFAGYILADLFILNYRPKMLPQVTSVQKKTPTSFQSGKFLTTYDRIRETNFFNTDGKIPPSLSSGEENLVPDEGEAVASQLPLELLGTIVHLNPKKSVATFFVQSKNKALPYSVGGKIEKIAQVVQIERRKVFIKNLRRNRLEFLKIKENLKINIGFKAPQKIQEGISQSAQGSFTVKKNLFDNLTSNLPSLLREAHVKPANSPSGELEGFEFVWIKRGSVFEELGFKRGDVIRGLNGKPIKNPQEALQAYNTFKKGGTNVSIDIIRDGQSMNLKYEVK